MSISTITPPVVRVAVVVGPSRIGHGLACKVDVTDGETGRALKLSVHPFLREETGREYRNIDQALDGAAFVINLLMTLGATVAEPERIQVVHMA